MSEESLFHEALAKSPGERSAFLDEACVGQPDLRAGAEGLLAAHEASRNFLAKPSQDPGETVDSDPDADATGERVSDLDEEAQHSAAGDYHPQIESGSVIGGRFTLVQKLGEGGRRRPLDCSQINATERVGALVLFAFERFLEIVMFLLPAIPTLLEEVRQLTQ